MQTLSSCSLSASPNIGSGGGGVHDRSSHYRQDSAAEQNHHHPTDRQQQMSPTSTAVSTSMTATATDGQPSGTAAAAAARQETAATLVENLAKLAASGTSAELLSSVHGANAASAANHVVNINTQGVESQRCTPQTSSYVAEEQSSREETLFNTIGMGIVPNFTRRCPVSSIGPEGSTASHLEDVRGEDATEAACKALQDAMERGMMSLASSLSQRQQAPQQRRPPKLCIRMGVPAKLSNPHELMHVDQYSLMKQLTPLTQREGVELQHIDLVVGGLWAEQHQNNSHLLSASQLPSSATKRIGVLTVIAFLSVAQYLPTPTVTSTVFSPQGQPFMTAANAINPPLNTASLPAMATQTLSSRLAQDQPLSSSWSTAATPAQAGNSMDHKQYFQQQHAAPQEEQDEDDDDDDDETMAESSVQVQAQQNQMKAVSASAPSSVPSAPDSGSSMDVLAHVSAEIRDQQVVPNTSPQLSRKPASTTQPPPSLSPLLQAVSQKETPSIPIPSSPPGHAMTDDHSVASHGEKYGNNTNYKKLPPGKTPKNNNRLFVKHTYQDFSDEMPTEDEKISITDSSSTEKTPNAAFPLKLHETLSEIERDGHDDIIGWLPHGRSFKIHKQQEFIQLILPKYFVMTKKSSFLRQLNLYGFNRLSGVGPDQASYYHEKFLRGMKFLCRRMQRCKVNGNRIRAAGNPDGEPNLSNYPPCPAGTILTHNVSNDDSNQEKNKASTGGSSTNPGSDKSEKFTGDNNGTPSASKSDNNGMNANGNSSVQHLATAAILQYMAQQQSPVAPAPPGMETLSSLLSLVPGRSPAPPSLLSSLQYHENLQQHSVTPKEANKSGRSLSLSSASSSESNNQVADTANGTRNQAVNQSGTSFPLKLHRILDKLESDRNSSVLSWLHHGRAFMVHNPDRFVNELMPLYFNQTKYSSFQRQLHMYNFQRISSGCDKGAYYHIHFQRGNPALCQKIQRSGAIGKGPKSQITAARAADPDFSQMPPLPPVPMGTVVDLPPRVVSFNSSSNSSASPLTAMAAAAGITQEQALSLMALQQQQQLHQQQLQQQRLQQHRRELEGHRPQPSHAFLSAPAPSVSSSSAAVDSE